MKLTPVVTVFITSHGRIAVFKRSERVGTYRGAWAGVAGFIERLPLQQAYVELQEEAGLTRDDVRLLGMGFPVLVEDAALDRTWAVHPFLFEVGDPDKITLDWEADKLRWIEPEEMAGLTTVPGLDRALAAVWPPFGDEALWTGLAGILVDTIHGAASLAASALGVIADYLKGYPSASRERLAAAMAACRPSMGVFPHMGARLALGEAPEDLSRTLAAAMAASSRNAADAMLNYERVLTNSYSSTVKQALLLRRPREVTVTESRPGAEGAALARDLASEGLRVKLIADSQAGLLVPEVDAVVVGCDAITSDNMIANKAGTSLIALAAQDAGVPCIAVAQTSKVVPPGVPYLNEEQEPEEIAPGVRMRNIVFDLTPMSRFSGVYTEEGLLTAERLDEIRAYIGSGSYSFGGA